MPMPPPPDLDALSIDEAAALIAEQTLAPVEKWHPDHCGDSEMRITADGTWLHQGSPIGRIAMVRKFASILRREEGGGYVLVNPGEKLDIAVDDAPFVAVKMRAEGGRIAFQTNLGDLVIVGPDHPLRFDMRDDGPHPYVHIRGGLEALVSRSVYYELANLALAGDDVPPGVWSDGVFFALEPA